MDGFLEIVTKDAAVTTTSTEGFAFKVDGDVVRATIESTECKRGILQAKYAYLQMTFKTFEEVKTIAETVQRENIVLYIQEIDEAICAKDLLKENSGLTSGVK